MARESLAAVLGDRLARRASRRAARRAPPSRRRSGRPSARAARRASRSSGRATSPRSAARARCGGWRRRRSLRRPRSRAPSRRSGRVTGQRRARARAARPAPRSAAAARAAWRRPAVAIRAHATTAGSVTGCHCPDSLAGLGQIARALTFRTVYLYRTPYYDVHRTKLPRAGGPHRGPGKRYGETPALAGLDLVVEPGTVLGLLGHNGAGKTTAVRILSTLLAPSEGRARRRPRRGRRSPRRARAGLARRPAGLARRAPDRAREPDAARAPAADLEARRAARSSDCSSASASPTRPTARSAPTPAACAGGSTSPPASSSAARRLSRRADHRARPRQPRGHVGRGRGPRRDGVALLLTTQYLEEADRLADQIVVLSGGRAVAAGTPAELKARVGDGVCTFAAGRRALQGAPPVERLDPELDLRARSPLRPRPRGPADLRARWTS